MQQRRLRSDSAASSFSSRSFRNDDFDLRDDAALGNQGEALERQRREQRREKDAAAAADLAQSRHRRVSSCLAQLESLNLERPAGMVLSGGGNGSGGVQGGGGAAGRSLGAGMGGGGTGAAWLQVPHPGNSHDVRDPHAQLVAARAHTDIRDLMHQRKGFSRDALRLRKRVVRAVHLVTIMGKRCKSNDPAGKLVREHSEREMIQAAMDDHHVSQKKKLAEVKTALKLLQAAVKTRQSVKSTRMKEILQKLGVEQLLEASRLNKNPHHRAPIHILDNVHTSHDVWTEGLHELPTEPCRLHRPRVRKGSHFVEGLTHLRHVASIHAMPELREVTAATTTTTTTTTTSHNDNNNSGNIGTGTSAKPGAEADGRTPASVGGVGVGL